MLKKFQNKYKKYTNPRTGIVYKIGDYVHGAGSIKGTIIALSANADFLLDTGDIIVSGRKIIHATNSNAPVEKQTFDPLPNKKTTTTKSGPKRAAPAAASADCESENQRLRRELDECNTRNLPSVVTNAPAEIQPKLPEYRQENLVQNMQTSANNIIAAAQSGNATAIRQEEKIISEAVKELKEVAPLQTVSASENCRVIRSDLKGKATIRIYFTDKPNDVAQKGLLKHNFKPYFDVINKKKDWYWGAYFTEERLKFATDFCGVETITEKTRHPNAFLPEEEIAALRGAERVAEIRRMLNILFPEIKFKVVTKSRNACNVFIEEAPYYFRRNSADNDKYTKRIFDEIVEVANRGVDTTYIPDSDSGDQPGFSVYVMLSLAFKYTSKFEKPIGKPDEKPVEKPADKKYEQDEFIKKHIIIARPDTPNFVKPPVKSTPAKTDNPKITLSPLLAELMPKNQQAFLRALYPEGQQEYKSIIAKLEKQVADIKKSQDGKGDQAIVKAHYFYGGSDWYITEYNGHGSLFGFAILNGDHDFAELGYMSMEEFNEVGKVEMDFHWTPRPLDEVLYKKSPSDYPKPKSMIEKEQPKPVQAKSPDPLPTPDEPDNSGDDDGDKELKELIAMMNKALKEKTA